MDEEVAPTRRNVLELLAIPATVEVGDTASTNSSPDMLATHTSPLSSVEVRLVDLPQPRSPGRTLPGSRVGELTVATEELPEDGAATSTAGGDGLPAQAAELERAIRGLQSRWLQIQDVVAGMQETLQYIEDHQTGLSSSGGGGVAHPQRASGAAVVVAPALGLTSVHTPAPAVMANVYDVNAATSDGTPNRTETSEAGEALLLQTRAPFTEQEKLSMAGAWRQRGRTV